MSGRAAPGRLGRRSDSPLAEQEAAPPENDPIEAVAFLQQAAGNAAVRDAGRGCGEIVAAQAARPLRVRRARDVGTSQPMLSIGGVVLSQGDLIALGDLYESPEEVLRADRAELEELVKLIHQDLDFYESGKGKSVGHEEWQRPTKVPARAAGLRRREVRVVVLGELHVTSSSPGPAGWRPCASRVREDRPRRAQREHDGEGRRDRGREPGR